MKGDASIANTKYSISGSKMAMVFGFVLSGAAMVAVSFLTNLGAAIGLCCLTEIATVTLYSIPYGLLGNYHEFLMVNTSHHIVLWFEKLHVYLLVYGSTF